VKVTEPAVDWGSLRATAQWAASAAYCPYSGLQVGAAALVDDGRTITGCNVENASYGLGLCAECTLVGQLRLTGGVRGKRPFHRLNAGGRIEQGPNFGFAQNQHFAFHGTLGLLIFRKPMAWNNPQGLKSRIVALLYGSAKGRSESSHVMRHGKLSG